MDDTIDIHSVETLKQEKAELEQEFFEVSTRLDETTTKYNEISEACEQLRRQVESLEAERTLKTKHIFNLEGSKDALQSRLAELERKCDFLSQDKTSLTGVLEDRSLQIQSLEDQIRLLQEQLKKELVDKTINQQKLDDVSLIEQSLQHKEKLWAHERELFYEEKVQFKNQIMEREQQIQRLKRENALKILNLQKDVDFAENEKLQHKNDASKYKEENEKLKKQAEELNGKLKEAADHLATIQADHEKEMLCQTKLVTLFKESSEEAEKKVEQLTSCLEDTQALFDEAKNAHFAMREELANVEKEKEEMLKEKDTIIVELKDELEKANELLRSKHRVQLSDEEIAALSPGAAAAGRLIKSGQSLTQIYREHLKLVEELDQQKLENKRLEQYFRELVQDIEEKAPILKQQQNEYYRTVDHLEQVKMQLTAQQDDYQRLLNEKDANLRQLTFAKAELERFQRDNADLTSQVRELLQCIEKVRRGDYDAVTVNRFEQISDSTLNAEDFYLY
uniref:Uncharacterized protein n=1 Tax=Romanomermis culicivorax TaxID=13658 RepID=A0A915K217_ROMCU